MKRRHIYQFFVAFALVLALAFSFATVDTHAKTYKNYGSYAKTIKGTKYYINLSAYTSREPGEKYTGSCYIFKGKNNYKQFKYKVYGQYYKIGKNKYRYKKNSKNYLTITVKSNKKISIKQTGTIIKGVKLGGTYTLVKRFTP